MLESDGEVASHYAVVTFHYWLGHEFSEYAFIYLHVVIPHWFAMRKEGLNVTLKDIEDMPFSRNLTKKIVPIKYGQQTLF